MMFYLHSSGMRNIVLLVIGPISVKVNVYNRAVVLRITVPKYDTLTGLQIRLWRLFSENKTINI